jgi:hypothetical protein
VVGWLVTYDMGVLEGRRKGGTYAVVLCACGDTQRVCGDEECDEC